MNSPETWYYSGFRGSLLPRGYTQALREPGFAWEIVGVAICINRAIFAVLPGLRQQHYPIICVACVDNSGDLPGAQSFLILKQQEPAGCISDNTIRLRSQKCTKA